MQPLNIYIFGAKRELHLISEWPLCKGRVADPGLFTRDAGEGGSNYWRDPYLDT